MDLGLGFDDDDLCVENKEIKQPLTSYNAKTCHTEWFLTAEGDDDESQSNIRKYRADYYFGKQQYILAVDNYKEGMGYLSSQNRVMRKDMLESLARCYSYLGDREQALKIVSELMSDVSTTDNMVQILMLKQQLLDMFGMVKDEIEVIQELTVFHPYNAQFWLMLITAYKHLLSSDTSKLCPFEKNEKYSADIENSDNCNQNHDLEKEVEKSLTLNWSKSQEGHLESCVKCSEKTDTGQFTQNNMVLDAHKSNGNCLQNDKALSTDIEKAQNISFGAVKKKKECFCTETAQGSEKVGLNTNSSDCDEIICSRKENVKYHDGQLVSTQCFSTISHHGKDTEPQNATKEEFKSNTPYSIHRTDKNGIPSQLIILTFCVRARLLLKGVQGTIGSFLKARNQEQLSWVDKEIEELGLDDSVVQAATEFMMKDLYYQSYEDFTEDNQSSSSLDITADTNSTEEFHEKWFAWVKNTELDLSY